MRNALALLVLLGCSTEEPAADAPPLETEVHLVRTLRFADIVDGRTTGADLDNQGTRCGVDDLISHDGDEGIDNSFSQLLPTLAAAGGQALPDLVQNSVNSGELMITMEFDPPAEDGCAELSLSQALGTPSLGTDGTILPFQTFERDLELGNSVVSCASRNEGSYRGSDFDMRMPLFVFDEWIDLTIVGGYLELEVDEDGVGRGFMTGAVSVEEVRANVATFDGIGSTLPGVIETLLNTMADLDPDNTGSCTHLSAVLEVETVPAWYFTDR